MENNPFSVAGIGVYIPESRLDNTARAERFDYDPASLRDKIGVLQTARKAPGEETSDLCVKALENLTHKMGDALDLAEIDLIVVVTQHPDGCGLPHTSAILHGKLNMPKTCFAFDISLGCSGYVSALATVSGHLMAIGGQSALLFTADPYSKSLSEGDKNTSMIFGDAATVTLITPGNSWKIGRFDSGTIGQKADALERDTEGVLRMNGRAVFNFCALNVPPSIHRVLALNCVEMSDIDSFALHPGSKYIVDTISKRLGLPKPESLACAEYGNTVSSSIPIILNGLERLQNRRIIVSGFGVGLGWASCLLYSE